MKLLLLVFLALGVPVYAQTGEELFQKGQYAEAAAEFDFPGVIDGSVAPSRHAAQGAPSSVKRLEDPLPSRSSRQLVWRLRGPFTA